MENRKEYRSVLRTKKMIQQAAIELLDEKNEKKITVTDIANRADINRATFYSYYMNVDSIFDEIFDETFGKLQKYLEENDFKGFFENPKPFIYEMAVILEEERIFCKQFSSFSFFRKRIKEMESIFIQNIKDTYKGFINAENLWIEEACIHFLSAGMIEVYMKWLKGELEYSDSEISEELSTIIVSLVKSIRN